MEGIQKNKYMPPQSQKNVPLFIKVERYNEIIATIHNLRYYYIALKDAVEALIEIYDEVKRGLNLIENVLDNLNSKLTELDSKFLKPHGVEKIAEEKPMDRNLEEIEKYISDIHKYIEKLREQIKIASREGSR